MADIATGFLKAVEAFLNTRLGTMTKGAWKDTGHLLGALAPPDPPELKSRFEQLKADIEAMKPLVKEIAGKIDKQTALIAKMVKESSDDIGSDDFSIDTASRVAIRIGMALAAADETYRIVAAEVSKDDAGNVREAIRDDLMKPWNAWVEPFQSATADADNLLNSFGKSVLDIDNLVGELGQRVKLDREGGAFRLTAEFTKTESSSVKLFTLDETTFQAFLQFSDREVANPTDEEKTTLVQRGEKWYIGDVAIVGLRLRTILQPGLTKDPLLAKVMPGSSDPKTATITAISLDTAQGLYLGDGRANERAVLPTRFSFPGVELREVALGLVRNPAREVTGLELTTSVAARMGDVVGMQVVGSGFVVDLNGVADHHVMLAPLPVSPRWPDQIGLRIKAGPITGGGFIQRVERTYKVGGKDEKRVEFGGTLQLQMLKVGVTAIVILSPDPFSLVLIIGVRFPVPIDLSFGFTLNGIGGLLAIDRGLDVEALRIGMREHILDKMLFPDDPVSEAPKLLDSVAHVFPPVEGGFVVGPIVELGWGSQAKFVKMKVGVVLALPDPSIVILGSLVVQVPHEKAAIVDIKADVFVAVTPDYFLLFASMKGSKIAGFDVDGELGMYVQWSAGGAFELSVGGFHPEYEKLVGSKPRLGDLQRITIDLSPGGKDKNGKHNGPITFVIKAYFAITAGSVQLGVDGRLSADFAVIAARAWVTLDMIFIWSPRFAFKVSLEVGAEVDLFGCTIASVLLRGELEGTRPFSLKGRIKVDVWFLPTFDEDVGPITWGDPPPPTIETISALAVLKAAFDSRDSWKVVLPEHAAQLVSLASVEDVKEILAHPLAAIEVSQSQVPIGVKISHIGASAVAADMVTVNPPTTTAGPAAAISPLMTGFPPGHFFELTGEQLLSRAGFEEMQGGYRVAMATTPHVGPTTKETVAYRTYVRDRRDDLDTMTEVDWGFEKFGAAYVASSLVGRNAEVVVNPYATRVQPPVAVLPVGTSVLTDAATGATLLEQFGALSATEAAVIGDAIAAAGAADVARVTVRG